MSFFLSYRYIYFFLSFLPVYVFLSFFLTGIYVFLSFFLTGIYISFNKGSLRVVRSGIGINEQAQIELPGIKV